MSYCRCLADNTHIHMHLDSAMPYLGVVSVVMGIVRVGPIWTPTARLLEDLLGFVCPGLALCHTPLWRSGSHTHTHTHTHTHVGGGQEFKHRESLCKDHGTSCWCYSAVNIPVSNPCNLRSVMFSMKGKNESREQNKSKIEMQTFIFF